MLTLISTLFLLGLRHGVDWDHIAAITDIAGSSEDSKQGLLYGFLYILGHSCVIVTLGILAVAVGINLPDWVDAFMSPFVGVTLLILGIYLLYSVAVHGSAFKLQSRWMLLFRLLEKTHKHPHFHYPENFNKKTAFIIGCVHGIGAETPTQLLLFTTAAGATGPSSGIFLVLAFVLGLTISNLCISLISLFGYSSVQSHRFAYQTIGVISGIFSCILGVLILTGYDSILPAIL